MGHLDYAKAKIHSFESFRHQRHIWRFLDESVVFTNGCFDLLHTGHLTYLAHARDLGKHLVVGLNSDASVKRLKGENRPVNGLDDRALALACLNFVDAVIPFEEDTPAKLIDLVRPDVLVKGGDYAIHEIVGHELVQSYGGLVTTIDLVPGKSTTGLIERMNDHG